MRDKDCDIDFIKFCADYIAQERKEERDGSADNHRGVRNSLIDYFNRDSVSIDEITSHLLTSWERFLKSERTMVRIGKQCVVNLLRTLDIPEEAPSIISLKQNRGIYVVSA